ncbi:uncharacterized protein LOC134274127 [Saccostrea cucullata]|uniref:uncharacterized protein LOC134274127 n=1 Tax=Saccostrea cuccullata TaxID=36930 RepID=UPI002ECFE4DA
MLSISEQQTVLCKANLISKRIDSLLNPPPPSTSHSRSSSRNFVKSNISLLERKEAELRAAVVKKKFLAEEANIIRQKAELETKLKAIKIEEEIESKQAEVSALKEHSPELNLPSDDAFSRTQQYVESLPKGQRRGSYLPTFPPTITPPLQVQPTRLFNEPQRQPNTQTAYSLPELPEFSLSPLPVILPNETTQHVYVNSDNQPSAPIETHIENTPMNPTHREPIMDMTKFLLKKDLILSRITKYDDNPSLFLTWKLTFRNIMEDLSVTPSEELDMLVRYLGNESSRQAATIRKCNANDPETALRLVWERLEERYGAPELIESSLRRQISSFPKIGNQDMKRLYNLLDLVEEIASVKRQSQYASLFGYFDSPTGINPIVTKLPTSLQDKWTAEATKYKKRESAIYPPFTFFINFLKDMARMKNDPSFNYSCSDGEKPYVNHPKNFQKTTVVAARKTETQSSSNHVLTENNDLARCTLHNSNHTLNECNKFRSKTFEERKKFIMANGICLKCCGPNKHYAKNCTSLVRCGLCNQSSHPTALHTDNSSPQNHKRREDHGGEKNHEGEQRRQTVTISCTKICGTVRGTSKSCAKILPVKIYHKDSASHFRIVYAMLDDQSNHSLAAPSLLDAFNVGGPEYEYTLTSCSGSVMSAGRRAQGLVKEALDGSSSFDLPTLIECSDLPNNREEIPSPRIAEQYSHLTDIKDSIPELIETAEIELLIGRDLTSAHVVEDQRHVTGWSVPFAQKLPLGWVIIGPICLDAIHMPHKVTVHKTCVKQWPSFSIPAL